MANMTLAIQKNELDVIGVKYGHLPRLEKLFNETKDTMEFMEKGREESIKTQAEKIAIKKAELETKLRDVQRETETENQLKQKLIDTRDDYGRRSMTRNAKPRH